MSAMPIAAKLDEFGKPDRADDPCLCLVVAVGARHPRFHDCE